MSLPYRSGIAFRILSGVMRRVHQQLRKQRLRRWQRLCAADAAPFVTRLGRHLRIRVRPNPRDVVSERIFVDGYFEAPECRFVNAFLEPGMTVLDVGANIGQYTLIAADRVGPGGHVHSFEPNPDMFAELAGNVARNGFEARCTLNASAVTDKAGTATLSVHAPGEDVYGSLGSHQRVPTVGHRMVPTVTLDDYLAALPSPPVIDLLKMDIEGAELAALQGAARLLGAVHAPVLMIEVSDTNTEAFGYPARECLDLLESFGYAFHEIGYLGGLIPLRTRYGAGLEVNVAAIPPRHV